MFLNEFGIVGVVAVNSFRSGGVVTALGVILMLIAKGLELVRPCNDFMHISTNIMDCNIVKGIDTFEPIAVVFKHPYIKRGIVCKSVFNLVRVCGSSLSVERFEGNDLVLSGRITAVEVAL